YIARRCSTAGGVASRVFTREAITLIHESSSGIPRTINVICDNALVSGMALERHSVDRAIVVEACRDLRLKSNGAHSFHEPAVAGLGASTFPLRAAGRIITE